MILTMETWLTYTSACTLIILTPGPDNLLVINRGLSQGRYAALVSCAGSGLGLVLHIIGAVLGLAAVIQTTALAFITIKLLGAGYLIWFGIKALRSRDLISLSPKECVPLKAIFRAGFFTTALNPKPALFIVAFVPQFVSPGRGAVELQILSLSMWFAFLAFLIFVLLGSFASIFSQWLKAHPSITAGLNAGAGLTFIAAGMSVALIKRG